MQIYDRGTRLGCNMYSGVVLCVYFDKECAAFRYQCTVVPSSYSTNLCDVTITDGM